MRLRFIATIWLVFSLCPPMPVSAASFDCWRAESATEQAICADPELSRLDARIAHAYWQRLALTPPDQRAAVQREQRIWLVQRDAADGLRVTMERRLQALRAELPESAREALEHESGLAFAFLLSMPQAAPDGGSWELEPPAEFHPDEPTLRRYLAARFPRGAQIDAYRFNGTLLHHAIRAGLQSTAIWLLEQGADPTLGIEQDRLRSDALALAIRYQRWDVLDALRALPDFPPTAERAEAGWTQASTRDAMHELWQRGFPWPEGDARRCLLQRALDERLFELAAAMPERDPLIMAVDGTSHSGYWSRWQCRSPAQRTHDFRSRELTVGGFMASDFALLEALDGELQPPLLPYLLPMLGTPAEVEQLYTLALRQPFEDAEFTTLVLKRTLNLALAAETQRALVRRIPERALRRVLQDDELLLRWMAWARSQSAADFAWALQVVGEAPLDQRAAVLMRGMREQRFSLARAAEGNWAVLLAAFRGPLEWGAQSGMLELTTPTNWRRLAALGYRPVDEEVVNWLHSATVQQVRDGWPLLARQASFADGAIEGLLAPHRPPRCSALLTTADVEKAMLLLTFGARMP